MIIKLNYDKEEVRALARGRWKFIFTQLTDLVVEFLSGKHQPCPKCGGKDRARVLDIDSGALFCNQCFYENNGDGFAALAWLLGCSFSEAVNMVGSLLDSQQEYSQPVKGRPPAEKQATPLIDQIQILEPDRSKLDKWASHKPPVTGKAVEAVGGVLCSWPKKAPQKHQYECVAFPAYRDTNEPTGYILYRVDGENFPSVPNGPGERKTHLLRGSKDGWVFLGGRSAVEAAHTIWKVEGVPDALALYSCLPNGHAVVTNTHGAKAAKKCPMDIFKGIISKTVIVIGDTDAPGVKGAKTFCDVASNHAEVKLIELPYEVVESQGKDLRDYLNDPYYSGIDDLLRQVTNKEPYHSTSKTKGKKRKGSSNQKTNIDKVISNFELKVIEDEDGESRTITIASPMGQIIHKTYDLTGGHPKRCGNMLFYHEPDTNKDVDTFLNSSALTAWLGVMTGYPTKFAKSTGYHTTTEFYHELCRSAPNYDAIEKLPHEPKISGHYYACKFPRPGKGDAMRQLLERFNPATDIDADLIQAAIATLFWGGKSGQRPAFLITSDDGHGAGKTRLVSMLSHLAGGHIELSANEDIQSIKTRLLSPEGMIMRLALLDNVKTLKFSWAELEALITAPVISGRRMYIGEGTRPNNLTYFITLNGASLSTDIAQRCCIIKLAKPIYSGNWEDDTRAFIDQHREELVADALGFLQTDSEPLSHCSRWGAWERDIVAKLPEPTDVQKVMRERQQIADVDQEETQIIEDHFKEKLIEYHYSPDSDRVFIQSRIATKWLNEATNERHSATKVSRMIRQKIDEGCFVCIQENPSRTYGRGFLWVGQEWDCQTKTNTDLSQRMELTDRGYSDF